MAVSVGPTVSELLARARFEILPLEGITRQCKPGGLLRDLTPLQRLRAR